MNSKIILTYQLSPIQAAALSSLASSFSGTLKLRPVFPYEYAQSLGTLCGISGFPKKNRKPSAAPESGVLRRRRLFGDLLFRAFARVDRQIALQGLL